MTEDQSKNRINIIPIAELQENINQTVSGVVVRVSEVSSVSKDDNLLQVHILDQSTSHPFRISVYLNKQDRHPYFLVTFFI